jgi:hypothetical protein
MSGYQRMFLYAMLAGAIGLFLGSTQLKAQAQQQKPQEQQVQQQGVEVDVPDEEWDAYEKATKETDITKRVELLMAFKAKYPQSKMTTYIDSTFQTTLFELRNAKDYAKLLPAAEAWLKTAPNDLQAKIYAATAAEGLGNNEKYLEYALQLFAGGTGQLAYSIRSTYKKMGNNAKWEEWTKKLCSYPENAGNYGLFADLVKFYYDQKEMGKAAEYAQLTLKSMEVAKKPEDMTDSEWKKQITGDRTKLLTVIATNTQANKQWDQSIAVWEKLSKMDPSSDEPYYSIGTCLWQQNNIEEAIKFFAMAELCNGNLKAQAKEKVEKLYKPLHNDSTIGIEKQYTKAKAALEERKGK